MKATSVGLLSAFTYFCGLWVIARTYGLNHDPMKAGVIKATAYQMLIALPIGIHAIRPTLYHIFLNKAAEFCTLGLGFTQIPDRSVNTPKPDRSFNKTVRRS
jgi:hypothetical protein